MWYGLYYREIFKPLELLNLFFHLTVAIYNQLRFLAFQRRSQNLKQVPQNLMSYLPK